PPLIPTRGPIDEIKPKRYGRRLEKNRPAISSRRPNSNHAFDTRPPHGVTTWWHFETLPGCLTLCLSTDRARHLRAKPVPGGNGMHGRAARGNSRQWQGWMVSLALHAALGIGILSTLWRVPRPDSSQVLNTKVSGPFDEFSVTICEEPVHKLRPQPA